jgi:hypothetical protein
MVDGPRPGIARVLRISDQSSGPKPAQGLSWEDYEDGEDVKGSGADADEEDSTWDVVVNKKSQYIPEQPPPHTNPLEWHRRWNQNPFDLCVGHTGIK